jgi:hypothetical protein
VVSDRRQTQANDPRSTQELVDLYLGLSKQRNSWQTQASIRCSMRSTAISTVKTTSGSSGRFWMLSLPVNGNLELSRIPPIGCGTRFETMDRSTEQRAPRLGREVRADLQVNIR